MAHDKPISWEQGLFLQPQHFQLSDIYHDKQLITLSRMLMPFLWGVEEIKIDAALLANKIFSLESGKMLLPDGSIIEIPNNTVFMSREFGKDIADKEEMLVYVGVKALQNTKSNVTNVDNVKVSNVDTRYVSDNKISEVADLYYDGPKASVKSLQYAMRIFWDTEIASIQNYSLIPVAKIVNKGGKPTVDPDFIAPCLDVKTAANLHKKLETLYDTLMDRAKVLERYKHNWNTYDGDRNVQENLQLLQTLARYIFELQQTFLIRRTHPYHCYKVLANLATELSVFTPDLNIIGEDKRGTLLMPEYQHNNLTETFESLIRLILSTLDSMLLGTESMVAATWEDRYYVASFSDKFFASNKKFYLLVKSDNAADLPELQKMIESQAKLCAYSEINSTLEHAVAGIKITLLSTVPQGVPNINDCLYYAIDATASSWLKTMQDLKIAFYVGSNDSKLTINFAASEV